jgi:large subunit ribosomal protein L21
MWVVFESKKKQYLAKKDEVLKVERLEQKEGEIIIDKVLLLADDDKISVGAPYLDNVKVKAVIQGEKKDDKVLSYKFRRRKKSRRIRGHRQIHTVIKIAEIIQ